MKPYTVRVGKRGTLVIPANLRRQLRLEEGELVVLEPHDDSLTLRRAIPIPIERYDKERMAEFLLNNTVDEEDYEFVRRRVRGIGVRCPDAVPHCRPPKDSKGNETDLSR